MDAVDLVVDAHERQLAPRFRDAGEVDTPPQAGTLFPSGCLEEEGPLGVLRQGPACRGVSVVFVAEATEGTGADELGSVKSRLDVWIEKQAERSPEAALLVSRRRDGEEAVCQHAGVLPERL